MRSTFKIKRSALVKRPRISCERLRQLQGQIDPRLHLEVHPREAAAILELAISTFNDSGTHASLLDEELCVVDDLLEIAGYERGNSTSDLKKLVRRCFRAEKKLGIAIPRGAMTALSNGKRSVKRR